MANTEWPPSSPHGNTLGYYVYEKVYSCHHAKPFESEKEL